MTLPVLLVWKGYPSAGKTSISTILQRELGFNVLEFDAMRHEGLYGKPYTDLTTDQQKYIRFEIKKREYELLRAGSDVIIDSTHRTNSSATSSLDTTHEGREIPADKYLVVLRVERKELERREIPRRGSLRSILLCDEEWEEPEANPQGYKLLEYRNNDFAEQGRIIEDLKMRFERREKILAPAGN